MILWTSIIILLAALILTSIRAARGPTPYDRMLAANSFCSNTGLILAALVFVTGREEFLDLVLIYVLISFVSVIGALKFFRRRSFAPPLNDRENSHDA